MDLFIKIETFNAKMNALSDMDKKKYISEHYNWVRTIKSSEYEITSGYLVDINNNPGGGGLMFIKAKSFIKAEELIKKDPMIKNNLVNWELHRWIQI